jgi:hypothetical protein
MVDMSLIELATYKSAIKAPVWLQAMQDEINALCHNPFLGYSRFTFFFPLKKNKKILSKNITVKRGCQNAQKIVKI